MHEVMRVTGQKVKYVDDFMRHYSQNPKWGLRWLQTHVFRNYLKTDDIMLTFEEVSAAKHKVNNPRYRYFNLPFSAKMPLLTTK